MRPELRRILDDLPGLEAVLQRAADRYVRLSRVGGTVEVGEGERRAVERLGCRLDHRGRLKLTELDRVLRASRLGSPLPDVLADYRGGALETRAEARAREQAAWQLLKDRLLAPDPPEWVRRWIGSQEGSLRSESRRRGRTWGDALERVVRAAAELEALPDGVELPRLAERVLGDAHGLDSDQPAGRLLERMLVHRHAGAGFTLPLSAEDRETLFAMSGLSIDEISSTVHVAGLGGSDPLLVAARAGRHVLALPLRTVYAVRHDARAYRGVVFAVENRSVFAALHRAVYDVPAERYPTLVCTGGHLSLAALRLLDALAAAGAILRYSGDFDAKGLMIADALAGRLGSAFVPWRMDPDTYLRTIEARPAAWPIDPGILAPDVERRFGELVDLVRNRGAAFQEGWIDGLVEDVRAWAREDDADGPRS